MRVVQFAADGVGDKSYLIVAEERGCAAVVDAQRDVWTYLDEAERLAVRITHAFDTHVHNDFVSGSRSLHELTDAIVVQGQASFGYPVRHVRDGERVDVGGAFAMLALHTPGHTFQHVSYALEDGGNVVGLFTGGSLLIDTIGRTDLVSPGATEELARAQRASLLRLLEFPGATEVFATHGAGSFCSAGNAPDRNTSSISLEKNGNRAAQIALTEDEDAFVRFALHGLTEYPAYYAHMAPINLAGAAPLVTLPKLEPLDPRRAYELQRHGAALVDSRASLDFVRGFPRGARSMPLGESFAGYVGMVLPFDDELVLVLADDDDWRRAQGQLNRIGFDRARGYVAGGFPGWARADLPVDRLSAITIEQLHDLHKSSEADLVDVRFEPEWRNGHVPGATHLPIGVLPARLGDVSQTDGRRLVTMCAGGTRATLAASLLKRVGYDPLVVASGGFGEWQKHGWPTAHEH